MSDIDVLLRNMERLRPVLDKFRDELLEEFRQTGFEVTRARIQPGDVVIIRTRQDMTSEHDAARIRATAEEFFPGHKVLVIDASVDLQFLEADHYNGA